VNDDPTPDPAEGPAGPPPAELQAISRHLAQCPLCQVALRSPHRLGGVPPELLLEGPPDDPDRLVREVLRRVREEPVGAAPEPGVPRQYGPGGGR
jgi:hypothetical protein